MPTATGLGYPYLCENAWGYVCTSEGCIAKLREAQSKYNTIAINLNELPTEVD